MPMGAMGLLRFGGDELTCEKAMRLEWLETNELGGYACGTVAGVRTRRYHGLLVAALNPPTNRTLLLATVDEMIESDGEKFALGAHLFRDGTIVPDGTRWLKEFSLDWCPQWRYETPIATVTKRIFMPHMRNASVLRYFMHTSKSITLSVRLFITWRDHHWVTQPTTSFAIHAADHTIALFPDPQSPIPILHITHNGDTFIPISQWWHNFWLLIETERGLEDTEPLFCIGEIVKAFNGGGHLDIMTSTEPCSVDDVPCWEAMEWKRRFVEGGQCLRRNSAEAAPLSYLRCATDAFIALRSSTGTRTVIAGYPWFTDWGRDALIALTGLTLVTKRFSVAREILITFARYLSQGMVPNYFPEGGEPPAYNSVDATLWFVLSVYRYLRYTNDWETARRYWLSVLGEILRWHLNGTRYSIYADPEDGLLTWDSENEALTWMDAKVFGKPITSRSGKPVEVNALWCNALALITRIAAQLGDTETAGLAKAWAEHSIFNFERVFWNDEKQCLFDVIAPNGVPDASVRCNQLLALALPFRMLSPERERAVLRCVEGKLLTPFGLRTLSPDDPRYVGHYLGSPAQRDAAYHQGTVWAWWLGAYADGVAQVEGDEGVQMKVRPLLINFVERHLREACVGQVSEIFDGNPPHEPKGCFAQAWSVAEVLRAWVERVEKQMPKPIWDEN